MFRPKSFLSVFWGLVHFVSNTHPGYSQARICPHCLPRQDGDFLHREDALTPGWFGHVGIKLTPTGAGESQIYDMSTNRPKGRALQAGTLEQWMVGQPFWGAKKSIELDQRRLDMMAARLYTLTRMQTEYDGNHLNQKGRVFSRFDGSEYFEADCVGFVEGLYEMSQIDLTPNHLEGVLLLVKTQRDQSNASSVSLE